MLNDNKRLNIGIIGVGKAGNAFAAGFIDQNANVIGLFDANQKVMERCTEVVKKIPFLPVRDIIKKAQVIFITVNDDHIEVLAEQIAHMPDITFMDKLFVHVSGVCGLDVLNPLKEAGSKVCSLHPLQTFADYAQAWKGLYNIYFGYTGEEEYLDLLSPLISGFNGKVIVVKEENKPLYHAAACAFSNYTVALYHMAEELAMCAGMGKEDVLKAYRPLIEKTLENVFEKGCMASLTGPIARGDVNTVKRHLQYMKKNVKIYKTIGLHALEMAFVNKTIEKDAYIKIKELLQ